MTTISHRDPNRISKHSTNLSNTGLVNRIWIRFVARERAAKELFLGKEYWTAPIYIPLELRTGVAVDVRARGAPGQCGRDPQIS